VLKLARWIRKDHSPGQEITASGRTWQDPGGPQGDPCSQPDRSGRITARAREIIASGRTR